MERFRAASQEKEAKTVELQAERSDDDDDGGPCLEAVKRSLDIGVTRVFHRRFRK